jgi:hypothetical protein
MTVLGRLLSLNIRRWMVLATAFLAVGLLVAITGHRHLFPILWSSVLLVAILTLRSDWDRRAVLGAGFVAAFLSAVGTQDMVYPIAAAGVVYVLSVTWTRSGEGDTTWHLGVIKISLRPAVARVIRLIAGVGLMVAAILMAWTGT